MATSVYYNPGNTNIITAGTYTALATVGWGSESSLGDGDNVGPPQSIGGTLTIKSGISPVLAFKYIKKKFSFFEKMVLERRLKRLEAAFNQALENGQEALGNKILNEVALATRESALYAKGIRHYIERADIMKVKNKIRDGHISDTRFEQYTRVIPKNVISKKKDVQDVFDGFVIYHYYNTKNEEAIAAKQKMSADEKSKMRDPILFGWIKECDRLYFVADWEDEFCDLTFDEIITVVGKSDKLEKIPTLNLK